jgi:hypothetical protein
VLQVQALSPHIVGFVAVVPHTDGINNNQQLFPMAKERTATVFVSLNTPGKYSQQ